MSDHTENPYHPNHWIEYLGNYADAIAYAQLFWPEFKLYQDCVLLAEADQSRMHEIMQTVNNNRTAVETVINSRYLAYIFAHAEPAPTPEEIVALGRILREMWQAKLNSEFPDRNISVVFYEGSVDDLTSYEITFFQQR